jgi:hypothetical protein
MPEAYIQKHHSDNCYGCKIFTQNGIVFFRRGMIYYSLVEGSQLKKGVRPPLANKSMLVYHEYLRVFMWGQV